MNRHDDPLPDTPWWLKALFVLVGLGLIALLLRDGCARRAEADSMAAGLATFSRLLHDALHDERDRRQPVYVSFGEPTPLPKPSRRAELAAFVARYPRAPDPDVAANQLLYCEAVGGAKAELVAAVVAIESGWNPKARNPRSGARGLGQLLPSTSRAVYGKLPGSWEENLLQTAWYLQGCIAAERGAGNECVRYGLCRYLAGPRWRRSRRATALAYAKRALNLRGELP